MTVKYRNLGFLGFPDHRIGTDGSLWTRRKRGKGCRVPTQKQVDIILKTRRKGYAIRKIVELVDCPRDVVSRVVSQQPIKKVVPWRRVRGESIGGGYIRARLTSDMAKKAYWLHHLVLLAFVGPRPAGMEARHFPDRNPQNNHVKNLCWGTREENCADKVVHGTDGRGSRNGNSRLLEKDVIRMRKMYARGGWTWRTIAKEFGVSLPLVDKILRRKLWRHV